MIKECEFHHCDHLSKSVPAETLQCTQGRRLFIFINTKGPASISMDSSGKLSLLPSCHPHSPDKTTPAPALPISRSRRVSMTPLMGFQCRSQPPGGQAQASGVRKPEHLLVSGCKCVYVCPSRFSRSSYSNITYRSVPRSRVFTTYISQCELAYVTRTPVKKQNI